MSRTKQFSSDEAKHIGDSLGVDWDQVDLEQFRMGLPPEAHGDDRKLFAQERQNRHYRERHQPYPPFGQPAGHSVE